MLSESKGRMDGLGAIQVQPIAKSIWDRLSLPMPAAAVSLAAAKGDACVS